MSVRKVPGTALVNSATNETIYTPPEGETLLRDLLANWERFLHGQADLDPLIRLAVAHYQFEAIHPFTDGNGPERSNFQQVVLIERLRQAIAKLNPNIPATAREQALNQVLNLDTPIQLVANRRFHGLLVNGVPVEYQKDGETRGDYVRLLDFENKHNDWLAVNQFSIKGAKHTRRPDIILFLNGLPLVVIELKNPTDEKADIWKAYDQLQTYKEQIRIEKACIGPEN